MSLRDTALRAALAGATVVALGAATRNLLPRAMTPASDELVPGLSDDMAPREPASPDSLARVTALHNPFRLTRAPSAVPFTPDAAPTAEEPAEVPERPPRPALALAGVILGSEPAALIDGLPGVEGTRVLRVGERHGVYQLRSVDTDRAVVTSPDTTWTLHVRTRSP